MKLPKTVSADKSTNAESNSIEEETRGLKFNLQISRTHIFYKGYGYG
jgi:hypothetical protein